MKQYGIVPFRFGRAAPEIVSEDILNFYKWIILELTPNGNKHINSDQQANPLSLPLTLNENQTNRYAAFGKLKDFMDTWIDRVSYVILDLLDHRSAVRPGRIDDAVPRAPLKSHPITSATSCERWRAVI
jgi:hypothetical protein